MTYNDYRCPPLAYIKALLQIFGSLYPVPVNYIESKPGDLEVKFNQFKKDLFENLEFAAQTFLPAQLLIAKCYETGKHRSRQRRPDPDLKDHAKAIFYYQLALTNPQLSFYPETQRGNIIHTSESICKDLNKRIVKLEEERKELLKPCDDLLASHLTISDLRSIIFNYAFGRDAEIPTTENSLEIRPKI